MVGKAVNEDKRLTVNSKKAKVNGKKDFQQKHINWSYRNRGNVARTSIYKKQIVLVLSPKTNSSGKKKKLHEVHPPKKILLYKRDKVTIKQYSPK